jgi:hypothetical protein
MTVHEGAPDVLFTSTLVELILFLDLCVERHSIPPEEFSDQADMIRDRLETLRDTKRTFLLQVVAEMYHDAVGSDAQRATYLAGLYHEFAGTPPPE